MDGRKGVLMLLLATLLSNFIVTPVAIGKCSTQDSSASMASLARVSKSGYLDPELLESVDPTRVLIITRDDASPNEIAKHMLSARATPSFKGFYMMTGIMHSDEARILASDPRVLAVLKDRRIEYTVPTDLPTPSHSGSCILLPMKKQELGPERDASIGKPETTLREVVNLTGARKVWTDLGIDGANVTIAVVDTGVDYGSPGLGNWDTVARDRLGYPAAFDADAECMAITNTTLNATYMIGTKRYLNTTGLNPDVYFSLGPALGRPVVVKFSYLSGTRWPADMEITGIVSRSRNYHFGVMVQFWNMVPGWLIMQVFPVLVVDSVKPGVYDTVYVDISYDWAWLSWVSSNNPDVLPHWPTTGPPEFSFADEVPVTLTGWAVAARDFTGDEVCDLSAGSLGYFLDVWKASPNVADRGLVLKPIDPAGNYTVFVNDWWGHGTQCANSAAGRDAKQPSTGPGIAPSAKVMGIVALWIGDIIESELWAAGFDLVPDTKGWSDLIPGYGLVWGSWTYTGNHKADIISNSWGLSEWAWGLQGLHWYDLLTILEDALMIPGSLHPDYPGTVVVHAGGNGAAGYGTVTSPGYATLPISVGASTSFGTTSSKLYGVGGGYSDDVISWSAAGPTPLGNVKPDVVNVGAWAWVQGPVWSGLGEGKNTTAYFGGTSMATPLTSGSVALLLQAYTKAQGAKPTPEVAKIILKSTARDLGYDAFLQGSGRVDSFAAVSLALKTSGVTVTSAATWENVRSRIQYSWQSAQGFEPQPNMRPLTRPINDVGWFADVVRPGNSTSAEFTVTNPTNKTVTATITPLLHQQIGNTVIYSRMTGPLKGWMDGYGDKFTIDATSIPKEATLMIATLTVPYSYFDPDGDYVWNLRFRLFVIDWVDANHDGVTTASEVSVINYGYNTGTTCETRMVYPLSRFKGTPMFWLNQVNQSRALVVSVPYKVYVSYYKRDRFTWAETPGNVSVKPFSEESFAARLTVPAGTPQGIYEGQIILNVTAPYTRALAIPVSLEVPMVLSPRALAFNITTPEETRGLLYDPYRVKGYFDWRWRYEAGDWKIWLIDIQDPNVVAAYISCNWTGKKTDIDMFVIDPAGVITGNTTSPYLGDGRFKWRTRTGTTSQYVVSQTSNPLASPVPGVYTVLLHNVLFEGTAFPENLTGRVELVRLVTRGPLTIPVKPGKSASFNLTLTTGRALKDVKITAYPHTQFPLSIAPSNIPNVPAMGSMNFSVTVTVPEDIPAGVYPVFVGVSTPEIAGAPMYMPIRVFANVVADRTPPTMNIVSPVSNAVVGKTTFVEVYARDEEDLVDSVEYSITEGAYAGMVLDKSTGLWKASVDTAELKDGVNTLVVKATDKAGNPARTDLVLTVDNTKPTLSISSPTTGAELSGTSVIKFTASDTNLESVQLFIDESAFNVTGKTSFTWNTTTIGDGRHTIRFAAHDKAGNTAEASVTVATINSRLSVEATRNMYLVAGISAGLILGVVIMWQVQKRRLKTVPAGPISGPK